MAQISACELLYKYTTDSFDKNILKKEISDLKLMLDLIEQLQKKKKNKANLGIRTLSFNENLVGEFLFYEN